MKRFYLLAILLSAAFVSCERIPSEPEEPGNQTEEPGGQTGEDPGEQPGQNQTAGETIASIQSITVMPDYSDGSVRMTGGDRNPIRFEIYPLEIAQALTALDTDMLSLDCIETKAETSPFTNIPINEVTFENNIVTVYANATELPKDVRSGKTSVNARLKITGGHQIKTSSYFFLKFDPIPLLLTVTTLDATDIYGQRAVLNGSVTAGEDELPSGLSLGFVYAETAEGLEKSNNDYTANSISEDGHFSTWVPPFLEYNKTYYFVAYAKVGAEAFYGDVKSFDTGAIPTSTDVVDLGLSVKWAACNIGATTPEEIGNYFAWGETDTKRSFSLGTYSLYDSSTYQVIKYNTNVSIGPVDEKTVLEPEDDAAHVLLGGDWRIPTKEEFEELIGNCDVSRATSGQAGMLFTSRINGATLFIPSAGYLDWGREENYTGSGYYWSSTLAPDPTWSGTITIEGALRADILYLDLSGSSVNPSVSVHFRADGLPIRPVLGTPASPEIKVDVTTGDVTDLAAPEALFHGSLSISGAGQEPGKEAWFLYGTYGDDLYTLKTTGTKLPATLNGNSFTAQATQLGFSLTYYYVACAKIGDKEYYGTIRTFQTGESPDTHADAIVDMGLSVKWAAYNVGATSCEQVGNRYAWGEIETKDEYTWENYKWCQGTWNSLTKYNSTGRYGKVDNKSVLDLEDDAAHVNWGGNWRMPKRAEYEKLVQNCTCTWTSINGQEGILLTSTINGNSLFFPKPVYWMSELSLDSIAFTMLVQYNQNAVLYPESFYHYTLNNGGERYYGAFVRAVLE